MRIGRRVGVVDRAKFAVNGGKLDEALKPAKILLSQDGPAWPAIIRTMRETRFHSHVGLDRHADGQFGS